VAADVFTLLLGFIVASRNHISTMLVLTGILQLSQVALRKAKLPATHPAKRIAAPAVSVALFPVGLLDFYVMAAYLLSIALTPRTVSSLGLAGTAAYAAVLGVGGFTASSQVGRKLPTSVLVAGAGALAGGGALYEAVLHNGLGAWIAMGAGGFIGLVVYVALFFTVLPWESAMKTLGKAAAFSPFSTAMAVAETLLGVASGIGMVIL
jgi:hypothetical protein